MYTEKLHVQIPLTFFSSFPFPFQFSFPLAVCNCIREKEKINRIQLNRNVLENDWNYKLDLRLNDHHTAYPADANTRGII